MWYDLFMKKFFNIVALVIIWGIIIFSIVVSVIDETRIGAFTIILIVVAIIATNNTFGKKHEIITDSGLNQMPKGRFS